MTDRDDRGRPSGHVVLPGHTGHWPTESHVHRRCPACGEYFRTDDLAINVDHRGCQRAKAIAYERRATTVRALGAVLAAVLLACACDVPDDTPTEPQPMQSSTPAPTADPNTSPPPPPIIAAPAPKATPTPEPSPSPIATPPPGGSGEGAGECGSPTPPPLARINVKMHLREGDAWVLDSTPLVGPDVAYCNKIGYTDGRSMCPVRQEGNPQREACELYVTGRAVDTGRPGPTWRLDGRLCLGRASGCENHPENQYLVMAYRGGTYRACGRNGVCGEVAVDN